MEYGLRAIDAKTSVGTKVTFVLILVLMEYGLRGCNILAIMVVSGVLILVLMEYGLRVKHKHQADRSRAVLILVLMEYGLRVYQS